MTPKEKSAELISKYQFQLYDNLPSLQSDIFKLAMRKSAKQCALIGVDQIIAELDSERVFERLDFWNEVKQEIIKL